MMIENHYSDNIVYLINEKLFLEVYIILEINEYLIEVFI